MIQIDSNRVTQLGDAMLALKPKADFAAQITPLVTCDDETALRSFLWAAAICHATKGGLEGKFEGKVYKGWDYLLRAFCGVAELDPVLMSPKSMQGLNDTILLEILTKTADAPRVVLNDLDRRAAILRDTASELLSIAEGSVLNLLARAHHQIGGPDGAYFQLARLSAFQDELKKKSSAFLMTVHFSGKWKILDHQNVTPMIDYHRMRLLCRTGCIAIANNDVRRALAAKEPVPAEVEQRIRAVAADVCVRIVETTGLPMFDFDVLLWAHARSCCRNRPLCVSDNTPENESFFDYLGTSFKKDCVFSQWCPGACDQSYRSMWEPNFSTENY